MPETYMYKLHLCLRKFNQAQIFAFIDHEHKHPKDSVTDDNTDWAKFDLKALEEHLWEEMREYDNNNKLDDLVDLANMAFLVYTVRRLQEKL
jgi:predicted house-cleaning noncanonical NTP pyrophosphatase (MazG superfamily)